MADTMQLLLMVPREFLPIARNVVDSFIPTFLNISIVTVLILSDVAFL
jgi:hypothetical protein